MGLVGFILVQTLLYADMDNDLDIFVLLGIETSTAQTVILVKVIPRSSYIVYLFFWGGGILN